MINCKQQTRNNKTNKKNNKRQTTNNKQPTNNKHKHNKAASDLFKNLLCLPTMPQPSSHFEQLNQIIEVCIEDTDPSIPTSAISSSNNVNISFPYRSPCFHKQIDQPCVVSSTTDPLKKSQAATTCVGRGGSNTNTTDRRFGKNNHTTPSSSPSRKATASLLQSNHEHAAVLPRKMPSSLQIEKKLWSGLPNTVKIRWRYYLVGFIPISIHL